MSGKSINQTLALLLSLLFTVSCFAADKAKIVLHVGNNDPRSMQGAIEGAAAFQSEYGKENVIIEIVVNGLGISLVNVNNKYSGSVKTLMQRGVNFTACNASINRLLQAKQNISVIDGVKIVPFGMLRAYELQKQGYTYIST